MSKWYFKHPNDATYGPEIQGMMDAKDFRAVCIYWFILERLSAKQDGETVRINRKHMAKVFRTYSTQLEQSLNTVATHSELSWNTVRTQLELSSNSVGSEYEFRAHNFLKLQESRNKKTIYKTILDKTTVDYSNKKQSAETTTVEKPKTGSPVAAATFSKKVEEVTEAVLELLNSETNKSFSAKDKATLRNIASILELGFTKDQICRVIVEKSCEWSGQVNSKGQSLEVFLRPATLFDPEKFCRYVQELPNENT